MAYEFQKLSEVEVLTEVPEGASVLAEVNGDIKRVPGAGLGGSGIKTAIIKDSNYDNMLAGPAPSPAIAEGSTTTYECINMTFEEAYQTMASGEPLNIIGMLSDGGCLVISGVAIFTGDYAFGIPCIVVAWNFAALDFNLQLFWTADGLFFDPPYTEK
jgi:hypothetical protein